MGSRCKFVPVSQFCLVYYHKGLNSSGKKQTLATCIISLLGTLHIDIVQVAKIKATIDNVTRDDLQKRFLAQHSIAKLEQCHNYLKQCHNNVAMLYCANTFIIVNHLV